MSFGPYCYSNSGLSWRAVDKNYVAQTGEVIFADTPTSDQLTAAFSGYAAAVALQAVQVACVNAIAAGMQIECAGTPALNDTYSIDNGSVVNVNAVMTYIEVNGTFPGGNSTMAWAGANGVHLFPSTAVFQEFATAFGNFVAAIVLYGDSGGTVGALPSNPVSIA